jgi:GxxExxY protein
MVEGFFRASHGPSQRNPGEDFKPPRLARSGVLVERQKPINFEYDGIRIVEGFRADLLLDHILLVEVKSAERLAPVHSRQVLTYLRLLDLPLGLLMNFGGETFREGLKRVAGNRDLTPKTA